MWLINIHSLELELFVGNRIPEYAILSHRWGDKEASFEKFQSRQYDSREGGYGKIWDFCAQVAEGKGSINYAWVDTCCIDKRSSAELSESINSMFKWYRDAQICYVYLSDVDGQAPDIESELRKSQWFLRGWTLQEIVAPREILFFSKTWTLLGSKSKLVDIISSITKIERDYLLDEKPLYQASIAQRMSWASCRSTTREEDIAYSLLGIFDISMPLLYGEGTKAFIRLQEEILKQTKDDSILAWGYNLPRNCAFHQGLDHQFHILGALAQHPSWFAGCGSVVQCGIWEVLDHWSRSLEITNKGLHIRATVLPRLTGDEPTLSHGVLRRLQHFISVSRFALFRYVVLNCRSMCCYTTRIVIPLLSTNNQILCRLQPSRSTIESNYNTIVTNQH